MPSTGGKKSWRLSRWEETQGKGGNKGGPRSSVVMAKGGNVCDGGGGGGRARGEGGERPRGSPRREEGHSARRLRGDPEGGRAESGSEA